MPIENKFKDTTTRDKIESNMRNGVTTYHVYDTNNRVIEVYEAPISIRDNDPCLKTSFKYIGLTQQILVTKEEVVPWIAATYDYDNN